MWQGNKTKKYHNTLLRHGIFIFTEWHSQKRQKKSFLIKEASQYLRKHWMKLSRASTLKYIHLHTHMDISVHNSNNILCDYFSSFTSNEMHFFNFVKHSFVYDIIRSIFNTRKKLLIIYNEIISFENMTKYNILQTMTPSFVFFQMITCYFHSLSCLANNCVACPAMKWLNTSESLTFAARGWLKLWYKTGSGSQRGLPGDLQAEVTLCWKLESPRDLSDSHIT